MTASQDMIRGRSNIVTLTNNSGGGLVAGDVCVQDTTADEKVTTTTSAASVLKVFIAAETIASGAAGKFYESGYCPLVNVNASVTRGRFLFTHTVAKQAAENATYGAGAFGKLLKSGTTPSAIIYSATAQTSGGGAGSDTTAIHNNVASEISGITEKTSLTGNDLFIIEDSADSNNKKRVKQSNLGGGITMDQADPYGIHHRLSGSSADDDEFSAGSIGVAWTQVGQGGSATWSESNGVLSCVFTNTGSAKIATILRAATLADGESFETCVTAIGVNTEFLMTGLVITNGTASNSACLALLAYFNNDGATWKLSWWGGTVDALSGNSIATMANCKGIDHLRLRIFRTSSTVFGIKASIAAGVAFDQFGTTTTNPGFTPTHAGLLVSKWTNSGNGIVAYDYFRHV